MSPSGRRLRFGYCMGGRLGIHFVAATPAVCAFVAYYPSVRDEQPTRIRPRHPCDAAREINCPSMILCGGKDSTSTILKVVKFARVQALDVTSGAFLALLKI